ncbi:MAG: hypothetical protein QW678_03020 [Candidatus Aenigmatarchaeota archaeon]
MVSKELFLVLIIFFLFLFFNLIIEKSSACILDGGPYFRDPYCSNEVYNAKDFFASPFTGCVMGYSAGSLYKIVRYACTGPEAKWYDSPSYNGQICKRRDGWFCEANIKEGVYDASQGICVICDGKIQREAFTCGYDSNGNDYGDNRCESACGASNECDEVLPNSRSSISIKYYCNASCDAIECNITNQCKYFYSNDIKDTVYCAFYYVFIDEFRFSEWGWKPKKELIEDKSYPSMCFDGYNNNCNELIDCQEPGCAGARNPSNPWDICCQTDDDCPPKDGVKGKCSSPQGSGERDPTTGDYTYRCIWGKCRYNEDCIAGYCCTNDPSGPRTGEGICVPAGRIVPGKDGKSYICVRVESTRQANVFTNLFNLIFNKKQEGTYTIWMEEEEFLRMKSQRTTTFFDRIKNIFDILNQFFFQR